MSAKNTVFLLIFFLFPGLFFGSARILQAQSTLEYGSLVSGVAAASSNNETATAAEKQDGVAPSLNNVYGSTQKMLSKSADLLAQVGSGQDSIPQDEVKSRETEKNTVTTTLTNNTAQNLKTSNVGKTTVKVFLNDGTVVEGGLIGYGKNTIQVDVNAVAVTYFNEDIKRIEEYTP